MQSIQPHVLVLTLCEERPFGTLYAPNKIKGASIMLAPRLPQPLLKLRKGFFIPLAVV